MKLRNLSRYNRANSLQRTRPAELYAWGFEDQSNGLACRISNGRLFESVVRKKNFFRKFS